MSASRAVITAGALVLGLLVPVLELNATHLLNPEWPGHARLHEAWQLASNAALSAVCLWLAWKQGETRLAAGLQFCLVGGFLLAHGLSASYGGTMRHSDGTELAVLGMNVAVLVMLVLAAALLPVVLRPAAQRA